MSIGKRIQEFIDSQNMTVKEFAAKIDMSYENLYAYVSDKREPGAIVLKRFSDAGANINWILTGKKQSVQNIFETRLKSYEQVLKKYNIKDAHTLEKTLSAIISIKKILNRIE